MLLGFFGVCPNAHIQIAQLDQPVLMTFVFSGDSGEGQHTVSVTLVDERDGRMIASSAPIPITMSPETPTILAVPLLAVFRHAGLFSAGLLFEGEEQFRGEFRIGQSLA